MSIDSVIKEGLREKPLHYAARDTRKSSHPVES